MNITEVQFQACLYFLLNSFNGQYNKKKYQCAEYFYKMKFESGEKI